MYILYYMVAVKDGVAIAVRFVSYISSQIKKPLFPQREQGQKIHFCGTTLFAGKPATSATVPTHRLPLTQAIRHRILGDFTPFPLPSAAHLLPRFSLRSQLPELSVDALTVLLPRLWFVAVSDYSH